MFLYGASGHAKVVADIVKAAGQKVSGLIDDNPDIDEVMGINVIHSYTNQSPVIVTIGNCQTRKKVAESLDADFGMAIHPNAIISESADIGVGSVVMPGAIIQAESKIGKHCIINTKASVDHECKISDYVHIAPGATLSGNVEVGECTWIGVGACVKQGIKIGKNCMIGAGAVVVKDIPDNVVAFGNPCKVKRTNTK